MLELEDSEIVDESFSETFFCTCSCAHLMIKSWRATSIEDNIFARARCVVIGRLVLCNSWKLGKRCVKFGEYEECALYSEND